MAGSGGQSKTYGKPKWQMGVTGMPNDSRRDLPDVSLFASPGFDLTGYIYCQNDQTLTGAPVCDISNVANGGLDFGIVGGTSASAPAFAGIMALVNQYEASHGGTNRQGNANNILYALAKKAGASCASSATEASTCVFNDVTKGNSSLPTGGAGVGTNSVPCQGGSLNCSVPVGSGTGVLVDPAHTTTEAWTASPGYDLATGLGSVNANNLAKNWETVNTVATTTTLTLSQTTGITHVTDENVSVNITVTPTSATGSVSLIAKLADGTTQGLDQFTLVSGKVVNDTTNSLPGGTYTVTAHYAGDGTNAPSDSPAVALTVTPESSQTFIVVPTFDSSGNLISGNAASVPYGGNYIIRMYVTDKNGVASASGPPSPTCETENVLTCPNGAISLIANGSPLDGGTFALNNVGYTRDIAPTLTGGTYSLVSKYGGDSSYLGSTSATAAFTVTPASTQITVPYIPYSPEIVETPVSISTNVLTNVYSGVAPTGTITFYDGNTAIRSPVTYTPRAGVSSLAANLNAAITAAFTTSGIHAITAQYSGDANYAAGASTEWDATVLYSTTMTLTADSTTINYGGV